MNVGSGLMLRMILRTGRLVVLFTLAFFSIDFSSAIMRALRRESHAT
jgi:hypothetical protein